MDHGGLRGAVGRVVQAGDTRNVRGDLDDSAPLALADHLAGNRLPGEESAARVDGEGELPRIESQF